MNDLKGEDETGDDELEHEEDTRTPIDKGACRSPDIELTSNFLVEQGRYSRGPDGRTGGLDSVMSFRTGDLSFATRSTPSKSSFSDL